MVHLLLGAICIGFGPIFVKLVDAYPTSIAFYRCFLGVLIFIPILFVSKKNNSLTLSAPKWNLNLKNRNLIYPVIAGFLLSIQGYFWHHSIIYIGAGLSTLLISTQVFYLALFGFLFKREKISFSFLVCLIFAGLGIYMLTGDHTSLVYLSNYKEGVAFSLFSGLLYALFMITFKRGEEKLHSLTPTAYLSLVSIAASFFLFFLALLADEFEIPTHMRDWVYLFLLALFAQVIGWLLIGYGMRRTSYAWTGFILLMQPTVAMLMGWILFEERMDFIQMMGAILALGGVSIGTLSQYKNKNPRSSS